MTSNSNAIVCDCVKIILDLFLLWSIISLLCFEGLFAMRIVLVDFFSWQSAELISNFSRALSTVVRGMLSDVDVCFKERKEQLSISCLLSEKNISFVFSDRS